MLGKSWTNPGKIMGTSWEHVENHRKMVGTLWKIVENMGKSWENRGKSWENAGKLVENHRKNPGNIDAKHGTSGGKVLLSSMNNGGNPWNIMGIVWWFDMVP